MSQTPIRPKHGRVWYVVVSPDLGLGLLIGLGLFFGIDHDSSLTHDGVTILLAELGFGVALLAVVLTALTILVALLGEEYVLLLSRTALGVKGAIEPYRIVSIVSAVQALCALLGVICWTVAPRWGQAVAMAVPTGLATWAIMGVVMLVSTTAFHGELRSRMPEIKEAARDALEERRQRQGA